MLWKKVKRAKKIGTRVPGRVRKRDLEELGEERAEQRRQRQVQLETKYHEDLNLWNLDMVFALHPRVPGLLCHHKCR